MEESELVSKLTAVFTKVVELAMALGVENINQLEGAWVHQVDEQWRVAVNGHDEMVKIPDEERFMGICIPAYHCAVWFNGWLAGLVDPFGGTMAAGEAANEETLIGALERKIEEVSSLQ